MRKVLFILNTIDNGGSAILLRTILRNLDFNRFNIDILCVGGNPKTKFDIDERVSVRYLYKRDPSSSNNKITRLLYGFFKEIVPRFAIKKKCRLSGYDIAIDFKGQNLNILTACNCKKVLWSQKDYSLETNPIEKHYYETNRHKLSYKYKDYFFKRHIKRMDNVVCLTDDLKKTFCARWNYRLEKTLVIKNAIDCDDIIKKSLEPVEYVKPKNFTFCCMSRLAVGKGLERLFDCVESLNNEGFSFSVDVVGGGIGFPYINDLLLKKKIKNVRLLGEKDNPFPYVRLADAAVIPTETESYGLSFCETIVVGTPVIMTSVGVAPKILKDNKYGLLVGNDKESIYSGMKYFLLNPEKVRAYRNNSIEGNEYFDLKLVIQQIQELLDGNC